MASSTPCRTIPWDEHARTFHVVANDADAEKARHHFTKPHLYYLGSHEGCGCGFRREDHDMVDEPDEAAQRRENHVRLQSYIKDCLADQDFIELYACWSCDEAEPCNFRREVGVDELSKDDFIFQERELTRVVKT